ncbi:MAG: hypothetical protein K2Y13_01770 [Burkholderiaceae bacterium]|uniref:Secreted protein n=1 Tax=Herminiimonas contaminans TaxID=1111140 RepID=A0ABS0EWC4_9BURK|nr:MULTISPECIES: hypothetical protein [Oxalobacteraceae]MBF8178142.1 hypothetical protein [Herminiimonas contaminans]MBX9798163.1 hypothetical protein [Burkholderiaceae bacterium]
MSTRRKFVITLNLIALVIVALLVSIQRHASVAASTAENPAVEMQLVALPILASASQCGASCVVTSRAALGISTQIAQ